MKQISLIVLTLVAVSQADIGEKLRLGQSIRPVPQSNFNVGLQAPFSTNQNTVSLPRATINLAHHHDDNDENNLDRLCADPFHSFLCEPVGPRRNKINGQLRSGAQIPGNVFVGASSNQDVSKQEPFRTGGALLAASSFDSFSSNRNGYLPPDNPRQQSLPTQQFVTSKVNPARPSNEYLPSNSQPIPVRKDNAQLAPPLGQPQQNVYRYTAPPSRPNTFATQTTKSAFTQRAQLPYSTTTAPIRQSSPRFPPTAKPITTSMRPTIIARPSNQYLPAVQPIDIRVNPSSTNLSPVIEGTALLAETRQASPSKENQPKNQERQHTLEEFCNDAFHSFLCKPITKPRKRIDGNIRPGAKIPPHVLQGANTFGTSSRKLAPQEEGTALLSEGRVQQKAPQGYFYPKPQNNPFLDGQATNQQFIQNQLLKDNLPPIPKRIPPQSFNLPKQNAFSKNQPTPSPTQRPAQNFQLQGTFQSQTVKPITIPNMFNDGFPPIPERIPPPAQSNQNSFQRNQFKVQQKPVQNFQTQQNQFSTSRTPTTTLLPFNFNSQFPKFSTTTQRPNQFFPVNQSANKNNVQSRTQFGNSKSAYPQNNPIPAPAQITGGYQYQKPNTIFTYPTTSTRRPSDTKLNPLFIPTAPNFTTNLQTTQNQILTTSTTQRPASTSLKAVSPTVNYNYPKPSVTFTLPTTTRRYEASTVTPQPPTAIPSNNQLVTAAKPFPQNLVTGYQYPKPVQPFTLPATISTPKSTTLAGYSYPRPSKAFTLPARSGPASPQTFGSRLQVPLQAFNQFIASVNNNDNGDPSSDVALPPASQFEILKP
ncbi:uncharacterized protein [Rhodnius prolixus]|uniref:uncharacterized protein n=1 Tax=Rhodnius prolixus TaxID=13249 RepID=UPI003D188CFD